MKMLKSFSVAIATLAAMLPAGAFATTCIGSAGAVYMLVQDKANIGNNGGTQPFVGDKALAVGGPRGYSLNLTWNSDIHYCSNNGAGSADTHYPTTTTWNARNLLDVDSASGHPAMIHDNTFYPGTPAQPGTRYGFCQATSTTCTIDGSHYAFKLCCCQADDCTS